MPTQFDHLLMADWEKESQTLLEGLQAKRRDGEQEFVRRYNRFRSPATKIEVPGEEATYRDFHRSLLALLWALAGNHEALDALAELLDLPKPVPADYRRMPDRLLAALWDLARDGQALEVLWQRDGKLPIRHPKDLSEAGDNILGFLAWFYDNPIARSLLAQRVYDRSLTTMMARHSNKSQAEKEAHERAATLLADYLYTRWDYPNYSLIDPFIETNLGRRRIDKWRHELRQPTCEANLGNSAGEGIPEELRYPADEIGAVDQPEESAMRHEEFESACAQIPVKY